MESIQYSYLIIIGTGIDGACLPGSVHRCLVASHDIDIPYAISFGCEHSADVAQGRWINAAASIFRMGEASNDKELVFFQAKIPFIQASSPHHDASRKYDCPLDAADQEPIPPANELRVEIEITRFDRISFAIRQFVEYLRGCKRKMDRIDGGVEMMNRYLRKVEKPQHPLFVVEYFHFTR